MPASASRRLLLRLRRMHEEEEMLRVKRRGETRRGAVQGFKVRSFFHCQQSDSLVSCESSGLNLVALGRCNVHVLHASLQLPRASKRLQHGILLPREAMLLVGHPRALSQCRAVGLVLDSEPSFHQRWLAWYCNVARPLFQDFLK